MSKKIIVVGAGPGGIAAAVTAAENGADVTLIDENPGLGGQIWRQQLGKVKDKNSLKWVKRLNKQEVKFLASTTVLSIEDDLLCCVHLEAGKSEIKFDRLILACGAKELFLPFPGWTLPNVLGCGGAQALVKSGMSVDGKKIVVSGSGPLLLAVAFYLKKQGAQISGVFEQAEAKKLNQFAIYLAFKFPQKLLQGAIYRLALFAVPWKTGWWVKKATGTEKLEEVIVTDGKKEKNIPCDILACGYGLKANLELPRVLGCAVKNDFVEVDKYQQTSVRTIYAVGELTGIGGLEKALLEGENAACHALDHIESVQTLNSYNFFVHKLAAVFALRADVKKLAEASTIFCRCESVAYGDVCDADNQRAAKLYSRCGMGACQGRVCSTMGRELFGWEQNKIQTPLIPVNIDTLME